MAQENVERIKSLYEAFARGDIGAVLGVLDAQIIWNEAENLRYADGNPYVGPQAVLMGVFARIGAEWEGFSATPEDLLGSGDKVVGMGRYRGMFKATSKRADAQFVHVFQFRDGKVVRFQQYTDTAQFRDVMGGASAANA
jgi:ketosteroid isomerase-like protein